MKISGLTFRKLLSEFKEFPPGCYDEESMAIRPFSVITGEPCVEIDEDCYDLEGKVGNFNMMTGEPCPGNPDWPGYRPSDTMTLNQEGKKIKITRKQLRQLIFEVLNEEELSDVKPKWDPPEGLFTRSAETIVRTLKDAGKKKAMSRLVFYMNRCGDDCPNKTELNKAKEMLKKKD